MIVKSWRLKWAGYVSGLWNAGNHKASGRLSARELNVWANSCSWKNSHETDGTGSGSFPVTGFGSSDTGTAGFTKGVV